MNTLTRLLQRTVQATTLATVAHSKQVRKYNGEPYVLHPLRVAVMVCSTPDWTEDMFIAAILHDVVEDTPVTLEEIRQQFGENVARIVDGLTNKIPKSVPRAERKKLEAERLSRESHDVQVVKLCDRLDNVSELDTIGDEQFTRTYAEETKHLVDLIGSSSEELAKEIRSVIGKVVRPQTEA